MDQTCCPTFHMSTAPAIAFHCKGRRPAAFLHRGPQHSQPFLLCSELTGQNSRHCAAAIEGLDTDAAPLDLPHSALRKLHLVVEREVVGVRGQS